MNLSLTLNNPSRSLRGNITFHIASVMREEETKSWKHQVKFKLHRGDKIVHKQNKTVRLEVNAKSFFSPILGIKIEFTRSDDSLLQRA